MQNNQLSQIGVHEESITQINLQDLDLIGYPGFYVEDFSRIKESKETGADWEWWFIQENLAFGMAVQAKRLLEDNTYSIDYVPENKMPQVERLLRYCQANGLTPLYCFYNYFTIEMEISNSIDWPCGSMGKRTELWGCAVAHGEQIYRLYKNAQKSLAAIAPFTMPWHCIVCCPAYKGEDGSPMGPANRASGISQRLRGIASDPDAPKGISLEDDKLFGYKYAEPLPEPPPKIAKFLARRKEGTPMDEAFIKEYWPETPPRNLAVIDARKAK